MMWISGWGMYPPWWDLRPCNRWQHQLWLSQSLLTVPEVNSHHHHNHHNHRRHHHHHHHRHHQHHHHHGNLYLLWWDVEWDCPEVNFLVRINTRDHKEDSFKMMNMMTIMMTIMMTTCMHQYKGSHRGFLKRIVFTFRKQDTDIKEISKNKNNI